jgi:hypothetical protein
MRTNTVARLEKKPVSTGNRTKAMRNWRVLLHFAALVVMLGLAGCDEYYGYYGAHPGYTDRITGVMGPTAMVITWAGPIMSGGRDIGLGGTVNKSGAAAIMCW